MTAQARASVTHFSTGLMIVFDRFYFPLRVEQRRLRIFYTEFIPLTFKIVKKNRQFFFQPWRQFMVSLDIFNVALTTRWY